MFISDSIRVPRLILCLFALLASAGGALAQERGTVVVHNNTGATLTVYATGTGAENAHDPTIVVPPELIGELQVLPGYRDVVFIADRMTGEPAYSQRIFVQRGGSYEIEVFPADFGMWAMMDPPGASATPDIAEPDLASMLPPEFELFEERPRDTRCRTLDRDWELSDPYYFLITLVGTCPSPFITRGKERVGGVVYRWCAYCGPGFKSTLDTNYCCRPLE